MPSKLPPSGENSSNSDTPTQLDLLAEIFPPPVETPSETPTKPEQKDKLKRRGKGTLERIRVDTRTAMTDAAKAKGASSDEFYSNLTEAVHTGIFGQSTDEFYQSRGIPQRNRDFLNRQDQEGIIIGEIGARKGIEATEVDTPSTHEREAIILDGAKDGIKEARGFWDRLARLFGG